MAENRRSTEPQSDETPAEQDENNRNWSGDPKQPPREQAETPVESSGWGMDARHGGGYGDTAKRAGSDPEGQAQSAPTSTTDDLAKHDGIGGNFYGQQGQRREAETGWDGPEPADEGDSAG